MNRPIKKLLTLLKSSVTKDKEFRGMCFSIDILIDGEVISWDEWSELSDYLKDNRPEFCSRAFWWDMGVKKHRIEWLTDQIRKEKKKA